MSSLILVAIIAGIVVLAAFVLVIVMLTRKKSGSAYHYGPTGYVQNPTNAAFCPQCGSNLAPDSVFCAECGCRVR